MWEQEGGQQKALNLWHTTMQIKKEARRLPPSFDKHNLFMKPEEHTNKDLKSVGFYGRSTR